MDKSTTWRFIVYEERLEEAIALCNSFAIEWFYIKHDRDYYTEETKTETGEIEHFIGEVKKEHYHFTIVKSYPISLEMAKKQFNQKTILAVKFDEALNYVLHANQKNKAQYSIDEVHYTGKKDLYKYLQKPQDENEAIISLIDLIEEAYEKQWTYKGLLIEVGKRQMWHYYRQGFNAIQPLMREKGIIR